MSDLKQCLEECLEKEDPNINDMPRAYKAHMFENMKKSDANELRRIAAPALWCLLNFSFDDEEVLYFLRKISCPTSCKEWYRRPYSGKRTESYTDPKYACYDVQYETGLYCLWEGNELVYVGVSERDILDRHRQHRRTKNFDRVSLIYDDHRISAYRFELYLILRFNPKYNIDFQSSERVLARRIA